MECRFCEYENNKDRILHIGNSVAVIFSNPRLTRGHLLVIPRRHVEKLSELSAEERTELFDTAIEYQERIMASVASGCDMRQHCRPFLPESRLKVHHIHIHLLPRTFEDELYHRVQKHEQEVFEDLLEEEREEMLRIFQE